MGLAGASVTKIEIPAAASSPPTAAAKAVDVGGVDMPSIVYESKSGPGA